LFLFNPNKFNAYWDGKPLENTYDDPKAKLRGAQAALFFFALLVIIPTFIVPIIDKLAAISIAVVLVILGLLTRKFPKTTTMLGSLYGTYEVYAYLDQSIQSGYWQNSTWFFVWLILRAGATLALIYGFGASIKRTGQTR
jgi:hypothetical protein